MRSTRAIDQRDSEKSLEVRLGGIYALERIARDSSKDYGPVMEVLTGYVRTHAPWDDQKPAPEGMPALTVDTQAALTILGRRTHRYGMAQDHGVVQVALENLKGDVYPNPATSLVKMHTSNIESSHGRLIISDVGGRIIKTGEVILSGQKDVEINSSSFDQGVYFVRLLAGDTIIQSSFVTI
jgi:type IX secretion system substrate protein